MKIETKFGIGDKVFVKMSLYYGSGGSYRMIRRPVVVGPVKIININSYTGIGTTINCAQSVITYGIAAPYRDWKNDIPEEDIYPDLVTAYREDITREESPDA